MMIELIYSPRWFYGKDIAIDIVSIFVLLLIAYFSLKYYRINYRISNKNKNYLLFAASFGAIALSFLFKIITNFTIYYSTVQTEQLGSMTYIYRVLQSSNALFFYGFFVHRMLMIVGLFMLYLIYSKTNRTNIIIISCLILILTYSARSTYFVFHITSLIFLVFISIQYWKNYRNTGHSTNRWLFYSFSLITLSQIVFIFMGMNTLFYVAAEIIQLLGYMGLLITFIKVLKDGKKKGKD